MAPQYGAKQLLVVTSTSISVKNLIILIKQAILDMKMAGVDEPVGGYTSEQLSKHLCENQAARVAEGEGQILLGAGGWLSERLFFVLNTFSFITMVRRQAFYFEDVE